MSFHKTESKSKIVSLSTARIKYVLNYWKQKHCLVLSIDLLSRPLTLVHWLRFCHAKVTQIIQVPMKVHCTPVRHHIIITFLSVYLPIYLFIYFTYLFMILIYIFFIYFPYDKLANNYSIQTFFFHINLSVS